ncbi:hypothetical protein MHYP_G00192800 [Metynnis hypsauchen]
MGDEGDNILAVLPLMDSLQSASTFEGKGNRGSGLDGMHESDAKGPLRERNEWCWDEPQRMAFHRLKEELSSPKTLAQYSPERETRVAAEASSYGIAAELTQKQRDDTW